MARHYASSIRPILEALYRRAIRAAGSEDLQLSFDASLAAELQLSGCGILGIRSLGLSVQNASPTRKTADRRSAGEFFRYRVASADVHDPGLGSLGRLVSPKFATSRAVSCATLFPAERPSLGESAEIGPRISAPQLSTTVGR